ncbi:hypothetical protein RMSM_07433, partial [Rhodopirellula maiorica SM1]
MFEKEKQVVEMLARVLKTPRQCCVLVVNNTLTWPEEERPVFTELGAEEELRLYACRRLGQSRNSIINLEPRWTKLGVRTTDDVSSAEACGPARTIWFHGQKAEVFAFGQEDLKSLWDSILNLDYKPTDIFLAAIALTNVTKDWLLPLTNYFQLEDRELVNVDGHKEWKQIEIVDVEEIEEELLVDGEAEDFKSKPFAVQYFRDVGERQLLHEIPQFDLRDDPLSQSIYSQGDDQIRTTWFAEVLCYDIRIAATYHFEQNLAHWREMQRFESDWNKWYTEQWKGQPADKKAALKAMPTWKSEKDGYQDRDK